MTASLKTGTRAALWCATAIAVAVLAACGGGGGESPAATGGSHVATITGAATAQITGTSTTAAGVLTVADADAGQAVFAQPSAASLVGRYGSWQVSLVGATAVWQYGLTTPNVATSGTDSLTLQSIDGTATQTITVSIATTSGGGTGGSGGLVTTVPAPVYTGAYAADKVAVFNRLNDDRSRCGFGKLAQNDKLDLAAQNHADYHALNKIANTHYEIAGNPGFSGQGPSERISGTGYSYLSGVEVLAQQSYGPWFIGDPTVKNDYSSVALNASNILKKLYSSVYHLSGLMGSQHEIGIGVSNFDHSDVSHAKTLNINMATPLPKGIGQNLAVDVVATFPCGGTQALDPKFGAEDPDPFPDANRYNNPYGQPIYVASGHGTTVALVTGTFTLRGGASVATRTLSAANDPVKMLTLNEVFLVPTVRLADNSTYDVAMTGTSTGLVSATNPTGAWSKSFSFTTGTVLSE